MAKYQFTEDMKEISGFDDPYEECCRRMLNSALEWLDEHPSADPQYHGFKNVYGIAIEDNADAKLLSEAAAKGAGDYGPSGTQHQAVVSTALWVRANGWDAYVEQMTHPGGKAGILQDTLDRKIQDYDLLSKRFEELQAECDKRGEIIAIRILGWAKYKADNGVQEIYARSAEMTKELGCGSRLSEFVDQAISAMGVAA